MTPPVRAVLFDCDGVLVDSEPPANRLLSDLFARHGLHLSPEQCRAAFAGLNPRGLANRLIQLYGIDLTHTLVNHASAAFIDLLRRDGLPVVPGVADTLSRLLASGTSIATASNSPIDELLFKLRLAGLFDLFHPHHYSADELGKPKPDPAVYLLAADRLTTPPDACVVIEDSALGVRAGVAAGMRVWGFTATHPDPHHAQTLLSAGAERTVDSMSHIAALLLPSSPNA